MGALRSSEDDPKTSLNQHQSLSGEILPHFDINNLSVALKLKKLEKSPFHPKLYRVSQKKRSPHCRQFFSLLVSFHIIPICWPFYHIYQNKPAKQDWCDSCNDIVENHDSQESND